MNQITPEIKARVFALYIGADLFVPDEPKEHWYPFDMNESPLKLIGVVDNLPVVQRIAEQVYDRFNQTCLHLKPLSLITDEDAIEVAKMYLSDEVLHTVKHGKSLAEHFNINLRLSDHLRSKGYALPAFGYSVDELVEAGVFRLKEVNND